MIDSRAPSLAEVVRRAMDHRLSSVHVCMPAIVQSYNSAAQTCSVKPALLQQILNGDGEEETQEYPVINNVPVAGLRFGSWYIIAPLAKDDIVTLQFAERSLDQWRALAGVQNPVDLRMHDLADAIALPLNVYPDAAAIPAPPDHLVIGRIGGSTIHLKASGEIDLGSENPTEYVALATKVKIQLDALNSVLTPLGIDMTAIATAFTGLGIIPGPGTSTAAAVSSLQAGLWPASVASAKVKAD